MRSDKILSLNLDLNLLIENAIFHSFLKETNLPMSSGIDFNFKTCL